MENWKIEKNSLPLRNTFPRPMEFRQLKYFITTAEKLSFSKAARALHITQSTLSQQISALEGELGVKLFERNKHRMVLTDMGSALLPCALRTLQEADACIDRIHDVIHLECGEINIGTTHTFAPLLQDAVLEFMQQHPNIKLNIFCKSTEELLDLLKNRHIDVVLSFKPIEASDALESHVLFDSRLCVVMSKDHPLAKEKSLTFRNVEKFPVCMPAYGMQARHTFNQLLAKSSDTVLNVRLEIDEINILLNMIERSRSLISFLSQATIINHPNIVGVPLDAPDGMMQGSFIILKDSYVKFALKAFLKLLCENRSFSLAMFRLLER